MAGRRRGTRRPTTGVFCSAWLLEPSPSRRIVWTGDEIVDIDAALAVDPADGQHPTDRIGALARRAGRGRLGGRSHRGRPERRGLRPGHRHLGGCASERAHPAGCGRGVDRVRGVRRRLPHAGPRLRPARPTPGPRTRRCPLRFSECAPSVHVLPGEPLVATVRDLRLWDPASGRWLPIALPGLLSADDVVSTGDELYAVTGYGVYRLAADVLESGPRRLAVGGSLLDVPDGWSVAERRCRPAPGTDRAAEHDHHRRARRPGGRVPGAAPPTAMPPR